MKNRILNNWQAKIVCFLIALSIWMLVKNHDSAGFIDELWHGHFYRAFGSSQQ